MWLRIFCTSSPTLGAVLLFLAGTIVYTPTALGQERALASAEYSDDVVKRAARVYVGIRNIRQEYQQKLRKVDNPARAAPLQRKRRARIDKLLSEHNLTRKQYKKITAAAESNRELYQRLRTAINNVERE